MRLDIFKNFTLKWWQAGLFKWGVFALGIAVGACWPNAFAGLIPLLVRFAAISLIYIGYIWWKQ